MAFLDNSGDIILDAVLTDMGRKRLAAGRFTVSKFALGDEEINYELWDPSDARGTAFYDLEIMQTPILEAFTSDQSLMKSRLLSFARNDLLYLPILKLNNKTKNIHSTPYGTVSNGAVSSPVFYVAADKKTVNLGNDASPGGDLKEGVINGIPNQTHTGKTRFIAIDQGIENPDSNSSMSIVSPFDPAELKETAFIVKVDNRLLSISTVGGTGANAADVTARTPQYIDDDYVASYYFTHLQSGGAIKEGIDSGADFRGRGTVSVNESDDNAVTEAGEWEVFTGPLGRTLQIVPTVKPELRLADGVFKELGSTHTALTTRVDIADGVLDNFHKIETVITVQGLTTGYSIDIPIKIIKGIFS